MWSKKGLIFNVDAEQAWNSSHAQVPVVDVLSDRLRIYYATRNRKGQSNISYIEVDKENPGLILKKHDKALFEFGRPGSFDDSGLMPTCIINVGALKYLYYIGWTLRVSVPYQNSVGLAVSKDGGLSFTKLSEGPIITVNHLEPYFSGTCFVMQEDTVFKMWYLSCIGWIGDENKKDPIYNIKYAESSDGINWKQTGKVAIELEGDEGGVVSASVLKEDGIYKMWFAKRNKFDFREKLESSYQIAYAESKDGKNWIRIPEESQVSVSKTGWDSEMIAYPYVIDLNSRRFMFYNGNGFGKSGFGYAEKPL